MRNWALGLVISEDVVEISLIPFRDSQCSGCYNRMTPVLFRHAGESGESVKANDLPVVVVWLVHPSEGREERQVLPPADAKLYNDAVDMDDLLIQLIHKEYSRKRLAAQEQTQVVEHFFATNWTTRKQFIELSPSSQLLRRRKRDGPDLWLSTGIRWSPCFTSAPKFVDLKLSDLSN